jgi:hypothetical protein
LHDMPSGFELRGANIGDLLLVVMTLHRVEWPRWLLRVVDLGARGR